MNSRKTLIFAGCILASLLRGGEESCVYSIGVSFSASDRLYATADSGVDEEEGFRRFRFSSERLMGSMSAAFRERYSAWCAVGLSRMDIHSSEGETLRFEAMPSGEIGIRARLAEWGGGTMGLSASASLLYLTGDDPEVIAVHRDELPAGEGTISWAEGACALEVERRTGAVVFAGGVRIRAVSAEQSRKLPGMAEVDSSFEIEEPVGLFATASGPLSDRVGILGSVRFMDETVLSVGLRILL
jgi:hypothetical protein